MDGDRVGLMGALAPTEFFFNLPKKYVNLYNLPSLKIKNFQLIHIFPH